MQYGAVVYKYTRNLGDDIQAYAVSRFYPHLDYYIEREKIDSFYSYNGEKVATIMAGWYTHSPLNWPPSQYIYPLMVSMHFSKNMNCEFGDKVVNLLNDTPGLEWFEQSGEDGVGCRDKHTVDMLESMGIKAWWSGCVTLTLPRFENIEKHDKVVCVDICDEAVEVIKKYTQKEVVKMTHYYSEVNDMDRQMEIVEERLKYYQGSSLIVTTRLHAALPAIALGVPVLYVVAKNTDYRFGSYLKHLHCVDEGDILAETFTYDFESPLPNKEYLSAVGKSLAKICEDFVMYCENMEEIPTVNFTEFYDGVKRAERLKRLIYMTSNSRYLQNYSQKEEDPFILYLEGMEAYEAGKMERAADLFQRAYIGMAFESKNTRWMVVEMYLKVIIQLGCNQKAQEIYVGFKEAYGDLEAYKNWQCEE